MARRLFRPKAAERPTLVVAMALFLTGCLLISGETATFDVGADGGNLSSVFVSAEGSEERIIELGRPDIEALVIVIVEVASGDLEITPLQPDGSAAFVAASRPAMRVTRSGVVRTDAQGRIRYRISARGARDGAFQIFVQER